MEAPTNLPTNQAAAWTTTVTVPTPPRGDSMSLALTPTNKGVLSTQTSHLIHISSPKPQMLIRTPHQGTSSCPAILTATASLQQLESAPMILLVLPNGTNMARNMSYTHWIARQSTPADIPRSIWPASSRAIMTFLLCTSTSSPTGREVTQRAIKLIVF